MIIDTSAVMAILLQEPDARRYADAIATAGSRRMSVVALVELTIAAANRGGGMGDPELDAFLARSRVQFVPVDLAQANAARDAFRRFGKGQHPARLNFGDCFAYALAKVTGEPLLFKGGDFARTDVTPALA